MADLIRKNETANSVPKTTREPVRPQTAPKATAKASKSYGATDRQALDKLIETGGNRN